MLKNTIAAGIVLYNPDSEERFYKCIDSILSQIDKIYVFDNSTDGKKYKFCDEVVYMTENKNTGIAYALNKIMEAADSDGYSWVITMDQDSILPFNLVSEYIKYTDEENLGIICPQVIDKRRSYMSVKENPEIEYVDFCITSASCTSINAWKKIGKFDEWLFIDLVDNEFCKRLVVSNYKILKINKLVLDQQFGNIIPKSTKVQNFWIKISKLLKNQNFAKFGYKKKVSEFRVYYTCRNIIYVNNKLSKYGKIGYENYNCDGYLGFIISFCIPSFFRAQKKFKVLKAIFKGSIDGKKAKVEKWEYIDKDNNYLSR